MTGTTNPSLRPSEDAAGGVRARQLLAPLYGEAPALESGEAAEFEATRDLLVDWVEEPDGAELPDAMRATLLDHAFKRQGEASTISPLGGAVWLRRGGKGRVVAFSSHFQAFAGDLLMLPAGSRAEVRLPDGSSIMLKDHSRFIVGRIGGKDQGRLLAGRLYAWVEHQVRAAFRIATPLGMAAVVGTEFDLNLENHGECRLLVAKGQVNFETLPGKAPGGKTMTEVTKNRMYRCSESGGHVERLSRREVRRELAWIHGAPPPRRGRALLVILAILAMAGVGFFLARKDKTAGPDSASPAAATPKLTSRKDALAIAPLSSLMNGSIRVRTKFTQLWSSAGSATMLWKVLEASKEKGARISLFLEEISMADDQSLIAAGLAGRRFEYFVSPDGKQIRLTSGDSNPIRDMELKILFSLLATNDITWFHRRPSAIPGQQGTLEGKMSESGHPAAFLTYRRQPHFVGYAKREGFEMALLESAFTVSMGGGMAVRDISQPPATLRLLMDSLAVEGKGHYWADAQSGRIVAIEIVYRPLTLQGRMQIHAPGRPVTEQTQVIPENPKDIGHMTTTIEYLAQ